MRSRLKAYPWDGKRILVTGGAGFIGSHLVESLCRLGAQVTILDDLSTGRLSNLQHIKEKIRFIEGNITNWDLTRTAMEGQELVFHQAALVSEIDNRLPEQP